MTSQVYRLTAKALREQIKRGFTLTDFCMKYNCDETALKERMRRILCNNERAVNEAFNQILANGKKQNGMKGTRCVPADVAVVVEAALSAKETGTDKTLVVGAETVAGALDEMTIAAEAPTEPNEILPQADPLEALEEMSTQLVKEAQELKRKYTEHDRLYSLSLEKTQVLDAEIAELERELERKRGVRQDKAREATAHFESREQLRLLRRANADKQETVAAQIKKLIAVQLMVYESGVIKAVDEPEFALDGTGWEKLYVAMIDDDTYESLQLKDLRVLAQVIKIKENTIGREVKVLFDNSELQRMFDSLFPVNATPRAVSTM